MLSDGTERHLPVSAVTSCPSCATLTGQVIPPGGIVYQNAHWLFVLRQRPPLCAGQGFVLLKRHCECLSALTPEEQQSLGPTLVHVTRAIEQTLQPARVHFGLYAEQVRHLHFHVTPRRVQHPAGNIPLTFLQEWYRLLARVGVRRPVGDAAVAAVADQLRAACVNM